MGFEDNPMTIAGAMTKSLILLAIVVMSVLYTWFLYYNGRIANTMFYAIGTSSAAFVAGIYLTYHPKVSPFFAPLYAMLEGSAVGILTAMYESEKPGIALQAVAITFIVFAVTWLVYKTRLIKVTNEYTSILLVALSAILILYMGDILLTSTLGITIINQPGWVSFLISCLIIVIASLCLLSDFDTIETYAHDKLPKYMEWYTAYGLMLSIIWVYLEVLRMLANKSRSSSSRK